MALKEILLPPVLDRRRSPFYPLLFKAQDPADDYSIKAGWNLEVANHWELSYLDIAYTASAQVGNRGLYGYIYKVMGTGGNNTDYFKTEQTIGANESKEFVLSRVSATDITGMVTYDYMGTMLPGSYQFNGDDKFLIYAFNNLAGDKWTIRLLFRWLNWDLGLRIPEAQEIRPRFRKLRIW